MDYQKFETIAVTPSATGDGVFHVELNRPANRNAMNWQLWQECRQVFDTLAADGDCRVIVLSGRGKSFSSGLDVTDPQNMLPACEDPGRKALKVMVHVKVMQDGVSAVEACLKPVVCVVHGACVGAGVDLITAADVRLCTEDAYFCVKEVAVGLAADVGTLARLPKIVGNDSIVRELSLTARNCSADEARTLGLVSRVLSNKDAALEEALRMAGTIATHSPVAIVGTKKNLNYARDHTVQESLDYVATWNAAMLQSEDLMTAMGAALSKSKATFSKL